MIRRRTPLKRSTKPIRSRNSSRKCTHCWTGVGWLPLCPKTCPHCKGIGIEPRKPIPQKRAKPRRGPLRDPGYLAFLREEGDCVVCRILTRQWADRMRALGTDVTQLSPRSLLNRACDPAHGPVNGMRSKGPDNEALPLCRIHHEEQTSSTHALFAAKYGFEWQIEATGWFAAYQIWKEHTA